MLFSIITVTRNNLEGLQRTYESLAAQSFQGFEWLVIDGASDDGTQDFLESISANFTSEPDNGIYDAMNKGIDQANGFLLLFLNAGDVLADQNTLKELTAYIEELQTTPDFIYGDALEERLGSEPAYKPARPYKKAAYGMFTHHQAMFYRRDILDDLRYDTSYKIAADYKFTLQFLERAKAVIYAPFPLCLFESGGISQQKANPGRAEQFHIRKELNITSPLQNRLISLLQKMVWTARERFPNLYWLIKSKNRENKMSDDPEKKCCRHDFEENSCPHDHGEDSEEKSCCDKEEGCCSKDDDAEEKGCCPHHKPKEP